MNFEKLGERTIWIDADVIQGDGGTRTASITGGFIALMEAVEKLKKQGALLQSPVEDYIAAVSVGIIEGSPLLDLSYQEDSKAQVDMNFVMTGSGKFVEVQGTAEGSPFTRKEMNAMVALAKRGISKIISAQKEHVQLS